MKTRLLLTGLVMMNAFPSAVYAQFNGRQPSVMPPVDARERRLLRDRAVQYAGPAARALVESPEGDYGALVLLMCSKSVAVKFAAFHEAGGFGLLQRKRDYLIIIAQPNFRDPVALFVIQHAHELYDPDCTDAFLASPMEFSLNLKNLPDAAMERRAQRLMSSGPASTASVLPGNTKSLAWIVGLIGLGGLLVWRKMRHRAARDLPA